MLMADVRCHVRFLLPFPFLFLLPLHLVTDELYWVMVGEYRLLQLLPTRDRLPHIGEYARRQEDRAAH